MDPEALQTLSKVEGPVTKKASVKEGPVLQFNGTHVMALCFLLLPLGNHLATNRPLDLSGVRFLLKLKFQNA